MTQQPRYEVVWPLGKSAYQTVPLAKRDADLSGKTICELWQWLFKGHSLFPMIREQLSRRYPGIKFVDYETFGNIHGPKEAQIMGTLPEMLREHGCDAVIAGVGA